MFAIQLFICVLLYSICSFFNMYMLCICVWCARFQSFVSSRFVLQTILGVLIQKTFYHNFQYRQKTIADSFASSRICLHPYIYVFVIYSSCLITLIGGASSRCSNVNRQNTLVFINFRTFNPQLNHKHFGITYFNCLFSLGSPLFSQCDREHYLNIDWIILELIIFYIKLFLLCFI